MKKIAFILVTLIALTGCSIDDTETKIGYQYSKIVDADIPESFEIGENYVIEVTYLLPSACHSPVGIDVRRGGTLGEERRDIYVVGISSYDMDRTQCNIQDNDLTETATFTILVDENEPYTFYLWNGLNANNEAQFITVEVPVTGTPPSNQ